MGASMALLISVPAAVAAAVDGDRDRKIDALLRDAPTEVARRKSNVSSGSKPSSSSDTVPAPDKKKSRKRAAEDALPASTPTPRKRRRKSNLSKRKFQYS